MIIFSAVNMIVFHLFLICFICVLIYIYWQQKFTERAKKIAKFPSVKGFVPIFGHVLGYSAKPDKLFIQARETIKSFTETFSAWGANYPSLHVVTPEDAEIILTNMDAIYKSTVYELFASWLGDGLLLSNGNKWHSRRKLLTPAFHFSILQTFIPIFNKRSLQLVDILKEESEKPKTNIIPIIANQTLSTICETSMGINLEKDSESKNNYFSAVHSYANHVVERLFQIWFYVDLIYYFSSSSRKEKKIVKILHKFTRDIIKSKENQFLLSNKKFENTKLAMLELLLTEKENGNIDDDGIQEEVDTFVFAGHDTVSIAICFSLFLIASHKEVQDKIVEELNDIFGNSKRDSTYTDLQNMKYLECCLKEVMRLSPSVPGIIRILKKDIPLTSYVAPANTEIFVHIYNVHRDKRHYSDPEKFDPDRFLPENSKGRHPFAFIPFSAGPRNCIGQKYAMLELKVFISTILRNFILVEMQKPEDLKFTFDSVLRVIGPMYINFKSRY